MSSLRINSVQRNEEITIIVNGKPVQAYRGETLLAALIAAGFRHLKKSAVNNEKRGGLCGMGVCYECIVTVNGEKNVRSCMREVTPGMEVIIEE